MEHVEAGLVGGEPGALDLHAAERPDRHMPVGIAAPGAAPVLQLNHLADGFLDKNLNRVLIGKPVGARDGVLGVIIETVVGLDDGGGSSLGRDGVAPHRVNLGDNADRQPGVFLADGDGGPQAGTAAADDEDVVSQ